MNNRNIIILLIIVMAALMRFFPFPPNVAPIAALALFGGSMFSNRKIAFLIPLGALFISDIAFQLINGTGFHILMPFIYLSFILIVLIGTFLKKSINLITITGASVSASLLFFIISNFGVWLVTPAYALNLSGFIKCYTLAIPFFHYTLLGDLAFNAILFGSAYLVSIRYPLFISGNSGELGK